MDGSLFFRGLTAILDFFKRVAMGSFFVGLFIRDYEHSRDLKGSLFFRATNKVFNGLPKISLPETWPRGLASWISGSWVIRTLAKSLGTPIPNPADVSAPPNRDAADHLLARAYRGLGSRDGIRSIAKWLLFALPCWVLAIVVLTAPLLPTMILAVVIVPVLIFILLSRRVEIDYLAVFLLGFVLLNFVVAGILSITPRESMEIAAIVSLFMLTVIAIPACCGSQISVKFFFLTFLAGAGLTGLVGLYQFFGGYTVQIWQDTAVFGDIRLRVFSTLGNPNVYGTYLLLAIPLAAACIVYFRHPLLKLASMGLTGLLMINLVLTYSRGCYLSLALAVGIFVLIMEKRFVVLFLPAVMAVPLILPPAVLNRLLSVVDMTDTSSLFRMSIWQSSVRVLGDFWMTGIGQGAGAYNRVFPYYAFAATVAEHSHNLYIQIALELGVLGLLVFIGILACWFRTMVGFLRRNTDFRVRCVAAAMIVAVIAFLFQGLFDHALYNFRVLLTFYVFLGLGVAFARNCDAPVTRKIHESSFVSGFHE